MDVEPPQILDGCPAHGTVHPFEPGAPPLRIVFPHPGEFC